MLLLDGEAGLLPLLVASRMARILLPLLFAASVVLASTSACSSVSDIVSCLSRDTASGSSYCTSFLGISTSTVVVTVSPSQATATVTAGNKVTVTVTAASTAVKSFPTV